MAGVYQEYGEIRKIALEMALDRFRYAETGESILDLAEVFFQFLTKGKPEIPETSE